MQFFLHFSWFAGQLINLHWKGWEKKFFPAILSNFFGFAFKKNAVSQRSFHKLPSQVYFIFSLREKLLKLPRIQKSKEFRSVMSGLLYSGNHSNQVSVSWTKTKVHWVSVSEPKLFFLKPKLFLSKKFKFSSCFPTCWGDIDFYKLKKKI